MHSDLCIVIISLKCLIKKSYQWLNQIEETEKINKTPMHLFFQIEMTTLKGEKMIIPNILYKTKRLTSSQTKNQQIQMNKAKMVLRFSKVWSNILFLIPYAVHEGSVWYATNGNKMKGSKSSTNAIINFVRLVLKSTCLQKWTACN